MTTMTRKKIPIYADVEPQLKERLDRLAKLRHRKINAELEIMLTRYLSEEEAKEGVSPDDPDGGAKRAKRN